MAFIEMIDYKNANTELKNIYDELLATRGKLADVHRIQSLNPKTITSHMNLYMDIMFGQSPLKRYQREMIAVVVSAANQCEYCMLHHKEALMHYWKDETKISSLIEQNYSDDFNFRDKALCQYARTLTLQSQKSNEQQIKLLKESGLSEREILDATLVISYFNFVNRIVLGLGLNANEDEIKGYNY
jgi:uncharacterized peroxidase-related enzyme